MSASTGQKHPRSRSRDPGGRDHDYSSSSERKYDRPSPPERKRYRSSSPKPKSEPSDSRSRHHKTHKKHKKHSSKSEHHSRLHDPPDPVEASTEVETGGSSRRSETPDILTLNCIVQGSQSAFPVDIAPTKYVGHLKELILVKKPKTFDGMEADELELWRLLNVADERVDILNNLVLDEEKSDDENFRRVEKLDALGKRKAEREIALMRESKRKKWSVNSTILPRERPNVYFVDPAEKNVALLSDIAEGKYILMHGARASGKSTRTWRAMEQLQASGYFCLYITFTGINVRADEGSFWQSFGDAIRDALCDFFGPGGSLEIDATVPVIQTSNDFLNICLRQKELWKLLASKRKEQGQPKLIEGQFLVIFIDEFDALVYASNSSVRDSFLGVLHSIKTTDYRYAVQSVIGVGTFNILTLNTDSRALSPFNISDAFQNPNFTPEQVTTLFKEFATDYKYEIPDDVIQDICLNTNGHAGLVNLCGRAICSLLEENAYDLKGQLPYVRWKIYSGESLGVKIAEYRTFDKMLKSLKGSLEANNLLRTHFLGFCGNVEIKTDAKRDLANFLVSEGVLLPVGGIGNELKFKISSLYVDALIRRRILPSLDTTCPKIAPVKRTNGTYDILTMVVTAVHYFNKDILRNAVKHSFKTPKYGKVEGKTLQDVPRESVYDSELYRIFINWLVNNYGMTVTGQWHAVPVTDSINSIDPTIKHEYFDIVISTSIKEQRTIILELMASGVKAEFLKHFNKALVYGLSFNNPEIWVINFTCLDNAMTEPVWQNDDEFNQGLNVAHFWHDLAFKKMHMCARWHEDGYMKELKDTDLKLQNE